MRTTIFFITLFFSLYSYSQQAVIDSLEKIVGSQKGEEKVLNLGELCYQYAFINIPKAITFGKEALAESQKTKDQTLIAQSWNDLSIPYLYKGDYDSSLFLNSKALEIREKMGDSLGVAKSLSKMANCYYEKGDLKSSLNYNLRGISIFKSAGEYGYVGQLLNNVGNIYDRNANYDKALEYFAEAVESAKKTNNTIAYITSSANVANTYQKIQKLKEAEKIFLDLIPVIEEQGNLEYLSAVYQGLGVNYRRQKLIDKGIEYYNKALEIYQETGSDVGVSLIKVNLGYCYLEKMQYEKAEKMLIEGLELAKKTNSNYNLQHAFLGLAHLETRKQNFEKSDQYFDLYIAHTDSIYNEESNRLIQEMQVKYDTEKKEKELAISNEQLAKEQLSSKQKTIWIISITGVAVLLLILTWFMIKNQQAKRDKLRQEALVNLEKERVRISRDLHDNLGAELTLITSQIDTRAFKSNNQLEKDELTKIADNSRNAISQLRETIWSIRNEQVTIPEFASKVREYANKILEDKKIDFIMECNAPDKVLSPNQALSLYRVCQEAINNASKYSNCTELKANYSCPGSQFVLEISDNGKGFDMQTVKRGYGLQNMEQRVKELAGKFAIKSTPGIGTIVSLGINI